MEKFYPAHGNLFGKADTQTLREALKKQIFESLSKAFDKTNEQECRWLQTRAAKQAIVDLHVEGIREYLAR